MEERMEGKQALGYMTDSKGRMVPEDMVTEIDKVRDELVREVVSRAADVRAALRQFKRSALADIKAFIELSAEKYGVAMGGKKGNITLTTYDGEYKILIAVNDNIYFDERLQVAKALIDECIREWSTGARSEIKALVEDAFYVDKQGKINTQRILGLRRLAIEHGKWRKAMEAIGESIQVAGTKEYLRIYKRGEEGDYQQLSLDVAAL